MAFILSLILALTTVGAPTHKQLVAVGLRNGVAVIGDSTTHGLSGGGAGPGTDLAGNLEWPRWAEMYLRVPFYNRAKDGDNTTQMLARWAHDMTPLKTRARWALIVAGINDIASGQFPVEYIKANIRKLRRRARLDGMTPIVGTITPGSWTGEKEAARLTINAWIRSSFRSIDFARETADPLDPSHTRNADDPGWYGPYPDGIHYGPKAKAAIGLAVARWFKWGWLAEWPLWH